MIDISKIVSKFTVVWYDSVSGEGVAESREGKKYMFHQAEYTGDYKRHHDIKIEAGEVLTAKPYDNGYTSILLGIVRSIEG